MTIPTWRERIDDPQSATTVFNAMKSEIDDLRAALATIEKDTIERCAKVCDEAIRDSDEFDWTPRDCAEAIRALKEQP